MESKADKYKRKKAEEAHIRQLDEDIERLRREQKERIRRQKDAIANVANYIFAYAPVAITLRTYKTGEQAGKHYLWLTVDHSKIDSDASSMGATHAYPDGAAIDGEGNVLVTSWGDIPRLRLRHEELKREMTLPARPAPPFCQSASPSSVTVGWTRQLVTIDRFELQFKPRSKNGFGMPIWRTASVEIKDDNYTMVELPSNTAFDFRVRAHNPVGWSPFSNQSAPLSTTPSPPGRPVAPAVFNPPRGPLRFKWSAPDDGGSRIVEFVFRAHVAGAAASSTAPGDNVEIRCPECECEGVGMREGTIYQVHVACVNAAGMGPFSSVVTFKTHGLSEADSLWLARRNEPGAAADSDLTGAVRRRSGNDILRRAGPWTEHWEESAGKCFYVNQRTGAHVWTCPPEFDNVQLGRGDGSGDGDGDSDWSDSDGDGADGGSTTLPGTPASGPGSPGRSSGPGASGRSGRATPGSPGTPPGPRPGPGGDASGASSATPPQRRERPQATRPRVLTGRERAASAQRLVGSSPGSPGGSAASPGLSARDVASARLGLAPLRIPRTGSMSAALAMSGGGMSPALLARPSSPMVATDTPEAVFRKKRYKLLRALRLAGAPAGTVGTPQAVPRGVLALELRRDDMFHQSFVKLRMQSASDVRRKLRVEFVGEEGIDAGGLTKDWYLQISRELFNPQYCLFSRVEGDSERYCISPLSEVQEQCDEYFRFVGRFLGKALYDVQLVDLPFASVIYKHLLGEPVGFDDLRELDPVYANSLQWMLDNEIADVVTETFTISRVAFGEVVEIPLKPGGADIEVDDTNKGEYVELVVDWRTRRAFERQLAAMMAGFEELVPSGELDAFGLEEFVLLCNGRPDVNIREMRAAAKYQGGLTESSDVSQFFWQAFSSFTPDERGQVLQFTTGTSRVPLDGFDPPFTITAATDLPRDALPKAHTCFNQLVLPAYRSVAQLAERLLFAASNTDGFLMG